MIFTEMSLWTRQWGRWVVQNNVVATAVAGKATYGPRVESQRQNYPRTNKAKREDKDKAKAKGEELQREKTSQRLSAIIAIRQATSVGSVGSQENQELMLWMVKEQAALGQPRLHYLQVSTLPMTGHHLHHMLVKTPYSNQLSPVYV